MAQFLCLSDLFKDNIYLKILKKGPKSIITFIGLLLLNKPNKKFHFYLITINKLILSLKNYLSFSFY